MKRKFKPWYFLIAAAISGLICIYALRQNNLHMVQLRNNVYTQDKNGGDVEEAVRQLREYVYAHMNTDLASGPNAIKPPIQLKYTYQRLQEASQQGSNVQADNSQIYTDAELYCQTLFPHGLSGSGRIPCVTQYIQSHSLKQAAPIDPALYQFDFEAARWSPDLAGWSLLVTALFTLLFIGFWVADHWFRVSQED